MVVESNFIVHHSDYLLDSAFNDCRIEREIIYDWNDDTFVELQLFDDPPDRIDNIYRELHPIHIELMRLKQKDMIVRDVHGRLTVLTVMPF